MRYPTGKKPSPDAYLLPLRDVGIARLPEVTRRATLMAKESNPDWGCERIAAILVRGLALLASPEAVARVLREAGYRPGGDPG